MRGVVRAMSWLAVSCWSCSADWWSVGILLYELLCGEAPFACSTNKLTYDFIAYSSKMPYFPAHVSHNARDLITRLLCR